jgi:hypothetical protein
MQIFTDINGQKWTVNVTVATVKRVKARLDIDMLDIDSFLKLSQDIMTLCDILYVICESEAEKQGITDVQFAERLGGPVLWDAKNAVREAYLAFFPDPNAAAKLRVVTEKYDAVAVALKLTAGLVAFLVSPIGIAIAAIVGLLWYFGQIGNAIEWLKDVWASLFSTATKAWSGIVSAIAAGRIDLAMKVAWTGIKLVWTDGINFLYKWWLWLQNQALSAWDATVHYLMKGWNTFQGFLFEMFDEMDGTSFMEPTAAYIEEVYKSADMNLLLTTVL